MTLFVNLRAGPYGAVCSPYILEGDALTADPALSALTPDAIAPLARRKRVILATHGFNVSYESGLRSLARLEESLVIRPDELFLGVLWPGDFIIPAINYPLENGVATKSGRFLARFCDDQLGRAAAIVMLSHSLGGRVILEAIKHSRRRIERACIAAGAVGDRCFVEEYAAAWSNCGSIITLSSMSDTVLEYAYPIGDTLADAIFPDHRELEAALGRRGPAPPGLTGVTPYQIPDDPPYLHSDYYPPSDLAEDHPDAKWRRVAAFMSAAARGGRPQWP